METMFASTSYCTTGALHRSSFLKGNSSKLASSGSISSTLGFKANNNNNNLKLQRKSQRGLEISAVLAERPVETLVITELSNFSITFTAFFLFFFGKRLLMCIILCFSSMVK